MIAGSKRRKAKDGAGQGKTRRTGESESGDESEGDTIMSEE